MEAKEFVSAIRERVIEDSYKNYEEELKKNTDADGAELKEFLTLFKQLSANQQSGCLQFIRYVQVNALSKVLGILDGSTYLNERRESFVLTSEQSGDVINGEMQDIFLEMEEM